MRIAICDDDKIFAEDLKRRVENIMCSKEEKCTVYLYNNSKEIFLKIASTEYDLIFLDIKMPGMTGFDIIEKLADNKITRKIVFITNYDALVFTALKYFPLYFMRKSRVNDELPIVLEKYQQLYVESKKVFYYKIKKEFFKINTENIIYLTYWNHKITLICSDGNKIEFRGKIKDCEEQLKDGNFFKTNAGTIVNVEHCKSLNGRVFTMDNSDVITVSRDRKEAAEKIFMKS